MTVRTYSSPAAFKQALEQRLRSAAKAGNRPGQSHLSVSESWRQSASRVPGC